MVIGYNDFLTKFTFGKIIMRHVKKILEIANHYSDVIMCAMTFQITGLTIV